MGYSDEIQKSDTHKFSLVRIEGAKLCIGDLVTLISASSYQIYKTSLPIGTIIKDLTRWVSDESGTILTRIYRMPVDSDHDDADKYYYDFETGEIWFQVAAANFDLSKPLLINFYIFITSGVTRFLPMDVSSGDDVEWQPRLTGEPTFDFSQENNISGLLTISSSGISLSNNDLYFDDFFGTDYSFANRPVKVWSCVNGDENYRLEFVGSIRSASLSPSQCDFEIEDNLTTLDKTCYGNASNVYKNYQTFVVADPTNYIIREEDQLTPVTYLFGKLGTYSYQLMATGLDAKIKVPVPEKMISAVCISYNPVPSTSVNRRWSCGVGPAVAITLTYAGSSVINRIIGSYIDLRISPNMGGVDCRDVFAIGDTVRVGSYYERIVDVGPTSIYTFPDNPSITNAMAITRIQVPVVIISQNGVNYYLKAIRDYTCTVWTQGDLQITFVNNFEASYGMAPLNPDEDTIYVRFWNDSASSQASSIVQDLIDFAGVPTETSDFAPDQVIGYEWPDPYLSFNVPSPQETNYPTFRELLEMCLSSAMAFVYFDDNGNIRYKSFLDPIKPSDITVNESGSDPLNELSEKTSNDFNATFDFYDSFSGIKVEGLTRNSYQNGKELYTYLAVKKLNNTNKQFTHSSCIDTDTYIDIGDFYSALNLMMCSRRVTYSVSAFSPHFGIFLGDDLYVNRTKLAEMMRIIGIQKSEKQINFKLLDLKQFPELG